MFVYNDVRTDARVRREAASLAHAGFRVTVVGRGKAGVAPSELVDGFTILRTPAAAREGTAPGSGSPWLRRRTRPLARVRWLAGYAADFLRWRREAIRLVSRSTAAGDQQHVWHGHDFTGLVVADAARGEWGGRLVYDSHELYLEAGSAPRLPRLARAALARLERRLIHRADAVITVNGAVARELSSRYGVPLPRLVMNCPIVPETTPAHEASPLGTAVAIGGRRVILHHGNMDDGRGIRQAIGALLHLPADVVLVLLGDGPLAPELRALSETDVYRGRLLVHAAVPPAEVVAWVAGADVGVVTFEHVDLNNYLGTPNKLFECLAAGVPVVVSDFPEMRRIVESDDLGVVCDPTSPDSVADGVRRLLFEPPTAALARRQRCRAAALERYSWSAQEATLLNVYREVGR